MKKHGKFLTFIISAFMLLGSGVALAACNNEPTKIDYAHNGSVKLALDYADHDFFRDGIGEVTVATYIDGDTTHFRNVFGDTSTLIKSRYYGIDTPESTGAIQPFGKKASSFTKEKLKNAAENGTIVVSSPFSTAEDGAAGTYKAPETDSSGTRYLSLVWIHETKKHAPANELILLNLWIVQEGLSWAKNTSEVPYYAPVFSDAQKQAENLVLNLWSEFDPDYNYGGYDTVSLQDIKREVEEYLKDPSYVNKFSGANVRFTAVVAGYCDHNLYLQTYYPADDEDSAKSENPRGEWAGINFFCGMGAIPNEFTETGALLELVGKATNSDNFGFQISDGKFMSTASTTGLETDVCSVLLSAEQNNGEFEIIPFNYTSSELNEIAKKGETTNLFCRTNVTDELLCTQAKVSASGDVTLTFKDCQFQAYLPFTYHGDKTNPSDAWGSADKFLGKTFKLSGVYGYNVYKHFDGSADVTYQIVVCGDDDLICTTDTKGTTTGAPYSVSEAYENFEDRLSNVTYYVKGRVGDVKEEGSIIATSTYQELTIKEAVAKVKELADGGETENKYFIRGTIKTIDSAYNEERKNMSFTITDGANTMSVYNTQLSDAISPSVIKAGASVQIEGKLHKYVKGATTTPEITSGLVVGYSNTSVISFSMVDDGGHEINVDKAAVPASITETIKDQDATKEAEMRQEAIAAYLAKVVTGATASIKGLPTQEGGKIVYKDAVLLDIKPHGQTMEDPLSPREAKEIANRLDDNKYTADSYYIYGRIDGEIIMDNSNPNMIRFSFMLSFGGEEFYITGAVFKVTVPGITVDKVANGDYNYAVVTGKLLKSVDQAGAVTLTTRSNGCQLVGLSVIN